MISISFIPPIRKNQFQNKRNGIPKGNRCQIGEKPDQVDKPYTEPARSSRFFLAGLENYSKFTYNWVMIIKIKTIIKDQQLWRSMFGKLPVHKESG
jgi:hypothetical protein